MIASKMELRQWKKAEEYIPEGVIGKIAYVMQFGERAILQKYQRTLRTLEYHMNTHHRVRTLWYHIRLSYLQNRYLIHIPPNTCGKGLRIQHVGPILINGDARLGEKCTLHINTAIVAGNSTGGVPNIGNHVLIFTGATIVGGIHIADNIVIGANALVNKSFDIENITVAGVPARMIKDSGRIQ